MSSRSRVILLVSLAAFGLGGVWFASRALEPADAAGLETAGLDTGSLDAAAGGTGAGEVGPDATPSAEAELAAPADEQNEPAREAAPVAELDDAPSEVWTVPSDSLWLEGRVVFPPETPADEDIVVIARGRKFGSSDRRTHEVRPGADGRFRIAFAPDTRSGSVRLEGRYLYLEKSLRVKFGELPAEVLLEPKLGGCIVVQVTLPGSVAPEEMDSVTVTAHSWQDRAQVQRSASEHDAGRFQLGGVPALRAWTLVAAHEGLCDTQIELTGPDAGMLAETEIAVRRGVTLAGHLEDAAGEPVPLAGIEVVVRDGFAVNHAAMEQSGEDGTFRLEGVEPGDIELIAKKTGLEETTLELGALEDGQRLEAIVLRLDAGNVLAGLVKWPDGKPAADAKVEVYQKGNESYYDISLGSPSATVTTDAEGRFEIGGLSDAECRLRARARPSLDEGDAEEGLSLLERKRRTRKAPYWRAERDDLSPPNTSLVLVLDAGRSLNGRVVDDTGEALTRFTVRAREHTPSPLLLQRDNKLSVSERFDSDDGTFELPGVPDGKWTVTAKARGGAESRPSVVTTPQVEALTIVVPRRSSFAGIVVDTNGAPIADAQVIASPEHDVVKWMGVNPKATTEADGTFEIELAPGPYQVVAKRAGSADSETLELALEPAEERRGVTFSLRAGARITGVLDPAIGEVAGRRVGVNELDGQGWANPVTDAQGRFVASDLGPGRYHISLQLQDDFNPEEGDDALEWSTRQSMLPSTTVEVAEGETVHVVLGAAAADPVRLFGRATQGQSASPGVLLRVSAADDMTYATTTDGDGRYEVTVDGPGKYSISAGQSWGDQLSFGLEVPEGAASFEFDLEFPTGTLAGRLLRPDGSPAARAFVSVELRSSELAPEATGEMRMGLSEGDGSFVFERLGDGEYLLRASPSPWLFGADPDIGLATLEGLLIEGGGSLEDLVIEMPEPATIQGTVFGPDGSPAAGANVRLFDSKGRPLHQVESRWTDATGQYAWKGIGVGTFSVRATRESEASSDELVDVDEGTVVSVDLTLEEQ